MRTVVIMLLSVTCTTQAAAPPVPRVDLYGDPLPPGAIARLGSVRFRHPSSVYEAAFSSDGRWIAATNDHDDKIIIWERATGRKRREIVFPDRTPVLKLRFSSDGKRLYGRSVKFAESFVHAWNVATGGNARDVVTLPMQATLLGYSANGDEGVFRRASKLIHWDFTKGKPLAEHSRPRDPILAVALVGKRLMTATCDGAMLTMRESGKDKPLWQIAASRDPELSKSPVGFSDDGRLFAIENEVKRISVVETLTGKVVCEIRAESGKPFGALRISPDGKTLVASNQDGTVRLWDLPSGKQRAQLVSVEGMPRNFAFSPDSQTLIAGGSNNGHGLQMWDTATGKPREPFPGHLSPVSAFAIAPDGTVASISSMRGDPVVRLWNPETGRLLKTFTHPEGHHLTAVAFSPDGKTLGTADWITIGASNLRLWDVASGRLKLSFPAHEAPCTAVTFSPDGKWLVSGDSGSGRGSVHRGVLRVWDPQTGKRVREIEGINGSVQSIVLSSNGRKVFVAANGVHVLHFLSGKPLGKPLTDRGVRQLALSLDGQLLVTAASAGPVRLWDAHTHREIGLEANQQTGQTMALAPDGRMLAYRGTKGDVVLCDWPTGKELKRFATPGVFGLFAFSPDSRRLVTANGSDPFALVFDVSELVYRAEPANVTVADLQNWWDDLRSDDPVDAYRAIWRFHAAPEDSVPFLAKQLKPRWKITGAAIDQLIADLDDETFEKRDNATRRLEELGNDIAEVLQNARAASDSLEQQKRLDRLLAKLTGFGPSPETRRGIRAVAALARIGGPEVRKILESLAKGPSDNPLTLEARASLARLAATRR